MTLRRQTATSLLALIILSTAAYAQGPFALKSGDRVVFYGDSITDQRLYTTFAETFVLTRFPKLNVSFIHSGWSGDRVTGGGGGPVDIRLKRDVIAYKPTVMTIMLGMNDGSYRAYDESIFNTFAKGYKSIVKTMKEAVPGIRITGIQPSPFDDVTRAPGWNPGYNSVLARYGEFIKELGLKEKLTVADLNTPIVAVLEKARAADPALARKIVPDRVHPGPGGHLLMAGALLKAWNIPSIVTRVEIDAKSSRVERAVNTLVSGLTADGGLVWIQADNALPMPIDMSDPVIALSVRSTDFVETLDQEVLKVTGLTGAGYTLKIDGAFIGSFTKEQLSGGVNLALLPTPMMTQAVQVHSLTLLHNQIHFMRWRTVQVPLEKESLPSMQKALDGMDALEMDVVKRQRAAAQPLPHRFELTPQ